MAGPFAPFEPHGGGGPRIREIPLRMIVPNMMTVIAICAGLSGIRLAFEGRFEIAVIMLLVAAFLDAIDGRAARMLKASSKFGEQLDSLADVVNFGVAPVLVLYTYLLDGAGAFGWIAALVFAIACALRLARFNVALEDPNRPAWEGDYFVGVPAPAGGVLVLLPVYCGFLGLPTGDGVAVAASIYTIIIAMLIGIPAGILSAVRKGTVPDYAANAVALSGMSIPNFWLGIILIMIVSVQWRLLPASGYVPLTEDPVQSLRTMLMPSFVLATALAAYLMRHTRSAMLGVLTSDYIRTARAKGLLPKTVVLKHALRNALMPIVTLSTLLFGELLAGAVLTEQVFTIPGFGKLIVDAVFTRDYAVVQGVVLCTAVGFIFMNLLADVLYILINPRLRHPQ